MRGLINALTAFKMTFHLMETMILKEADNLNRDESIILAVIDSHV